MKGNRKKSTKLSYSDKKKMAVEHVKYFLNENNDIENLEFFNNHKKKDDFVTIHIYNVYILLIKSLKNSYII